MKKSGFKVPYSLENIDQKGLGIIATDDIKKGTLIWKPLYIKRYNEQTFNKLIVHMELSTTIESIRFFLNHIYGWNGFIIELLDDSKYMNHSSNANSGAGDKLGIFDPLGCNYALRDINAGEEITDDYSAYDNPSWYLELCKVYNVESAKDCAKKYI